MSEDIPLLLAYAIMMRLDITFFKYVFMFYLMSLAVGQIIQCPMMEQLADMWITTESEVPPQYMPNRSGGGQQNQEHLSPHQDLNPGYIEHKIVVLTTRFNAKTVVSQSYGLHEGSNVPNHPGNWTTGGNSKVYLTHKK
jgi:hypothetical protein